MSNESVEKQNGGSPFNGMLKIESIEDIWMTQKEMAALFETTKQNISFHVNSVKKELSVFKQLDSVVKEILTTGSDGKKYPTEAYSFDFILSIGYRVNSVVGMRFRQYATQAIKEKIVRDCKQKSEALEKKNMTLEKANETYKALIIEYFNRWQDEKYNREQDEELFHLQEAKQQWGKISDNTGKKKDRIRRPSMVSGNGRSVPMPSPYVQPDVIDCATIYGQLSEIETLQLTEGEA